MFKPGDKVVRISSEHSAPKSRRRMNPSGTPEMKKVYVVSDCWKTTLGWQVYFVGFGPTPIMNGLKTGWPAKAFRKLEEVQEENRRKQTVKI